MRASSTLYLFLFPFPCSLYPLLSGTRVSYTRSCTPDRTRTWSRPLVRRISPPSAWTAFLGFLGPRYLKNKSRLWCGCGLWMNGMKEVVGCRGVLHPKNLILILIKFYIFAVFRFSTRCPQWPTSQATALWSRPPTSSADSSPARSLLPVIIHTTSLSPHFMAHTDELQNI